jgi:hypothetical protein
MTYQGYQLELISPFKKLINYLGIILVICKPFKWNICMCYKITTHYGRVHPIVHNFGTVSWAIMSHGTKYK